MTKKELLARTKAELAELAEKAYKLSLKNALPKEEMVTLILGAATKKARQSSAKKKAAKAGTVAKKTSVKSVKKETAKTAKKKTTAAPKAKPTLRVVKTETKSVVREIKPAKVAKAAAKKAPAKKAPAKKTVSKVAAKRIAPAVATPKQEVKKEVASRAPSRPAPSRKAATGRKKAISTPHPLDKHVLPEEEAVHESKYYVAPSQEHLETGELPDRYHDDRVLLFVRDPYWMFGSWDINADTERTTRERNGLSPDDCRTLLRVYDVTDVTFDGYNAHRHFDLEVGVLEGTWYINVPEDDRSYCMDLGLLDHQGAFYTIARSNTVGVPRAGVSNRVDEEWMIADEEFWQMYALSGGFKEASSSEELAGAMRERLSGETSSGAVSSFSASEIMMRQKPADDFWFRLDCDLTVYGAAKKGAKVTLQGKPIQLRPDGTFTARFAFPDGLQVISAVAESENGRFEKTITPTVSRSTAAFDSRTPEEEE